MFEFLDHTADIAVRIRAASGAEFFEEAARAFLALLLDLDSSSAEPRRELPLHLEAEDAESLLVDFLNELIFLFDTQRMVVSEIVVEDARLESPASLRATLRGETFDASRHTARTAVKAATFHGLEVRRNSEGVEAVVVFDL